MLTKASAVSLKPPFLLEIMFLAATEWDFGKVISTACPSWTSILLQAICSVRKGFVLLTGHLRIWEGGTKSKSSGCSTLYKASNWASPERCRSRELPELQSNQGLKKDGNQSAAHENLAGRLMVQWAHRETSARGESDLAKGRYIRH